MADRFVREEECHRLTGLSRSTRWRLERSGSFPHRRQITERTIGWRESEVQQWIADRTETDTEPQREPAGD